MGTFGAAVGVGPGQSAIAHTDLQAAASSATILLAPLTYSGSAARAVLFGPDVDRFTVRARGEFTTRTTDPIVDIYLLYYRDGNVARIEPGATSIPSDGTILFQRMPDAAGVFDFTLAVTVATTEKDSTYKYSPQSVNTFYNSRAGYLSAATDPGGMASNFIWRDSAFGVLVLTQTAGNVSGGNDTLEAQVLAYGK